MLVPLRGRKKEWVLVPMRDRESVVTSEREREGVCVCVLVTLRGRERECVGVSER